MSSDVWLLSEYIMLKNITVKLIIYTVKAKKHHDNWNSDTEIIINKIKTSDMLSVSDTEEFTNFFDELMNFVSDIKQMHKHITS